MESLSQLMDYSRGTGIQIVIENQSSLLRGDSKMQDLRLMLDALPALGYVLDTGNFFCIGEDVQRALDLLSDRLVRVHCKDWQINPYGSFVRDNMPRFEGCVLGTGEIPLGALIKQLRQIQYSGRLVTEINAAFIQPADLAASIEFLRGELHV